MDIEERILEAEDFENTSDDCHNCPYKEKCFNQCMELKTIYNPVIMAMIAKKGK